MIKAKFFLDILVYDIWDMILWCYDIMILWYYDIMILWYLTFDILHMMYDEWFMMFGKLYICGYAILNIWYTAYDLWQMRNAIRDRIYLMMTMPTMMMTMMVTMVMMNGEWWMMNCVCPVLRLSFLGQNVGWMVAEGDGLHLTKVNPKINAPNSPQKAQKSGDQDAPPKVSVSLISLSTGIEEGV